MVAKINHLNFFSLFRYKFIYLLIQFIAIEMIDLFILSEQSMILIDYLFQGTANGWAPHKPASSYNEVSIVHRQLL